MKEIQDMDKKFEQNISQKSFLWVDTAILQVKDLQYHSHNSAVTNRKSYSIKAH
jgi:hypothetical protein